MDRHKSVRASSSPSFAKFSSSSLGIPNRSRNKISKLHGYQASWLPKNQAQSFQSHSLNRTNHTPYSAKMSTSASQSPKRPNEEDDNTRPFKKVHTRIVETDSVFENLTERTTSPITESQTGLYRLRRRASKTAQILERKKAKVSFNLINPNRSNHLNDCALGELDSSQFVRHARNCPEGDG